MGTTYLILSVAATYTGIILVFAPKLYEEIVFISGSIVVAGMVEGLTQEFDNLVCPILFYALLMIGHKVAYSSPFQLT